MEWHIVHTDVAAILAVFGLVLDAQSLVTNLKARRTGSPRTVIVFWPILIYVVAALVCDGSVAFKSGAIAAGIVLHLTCAVFLRPIYKP